MSFTPQHLNDYTLEQKLLDLFPQNFSYFAAFR